MTDKLILALDVDSAADALALVRRLKPQLSLFKVGLQLFIARGPGDSSRRCARRASTCSST